FTFYFNQIQLLIHQTNLYCHFSIFFFSSSSSCCCCSVSTSVSQKPVKIWRSNFAQRLESMTGRARAFLFL
ncbi:hypothetical protein GBAR_LOCUS17113, partial [Geodia barretti]